MSYEAALAQLKKLKSAASTTDKTDKSPNAPPSVSFVSSQLGASENFFPDERSEQQPHGRPENDPATTPWERIASLPLVEKLRIYGKPWPLKIDGHVVCWLVADDEAAKACAEAEPCYTAAEAERLSAMPAEVVQAMHKLKGRFGGTVTDYEKRRINEKRGRGDE